MWKEWENVVADNKFNALITGKSEGLLLSVAATEKFMSRNEDGVD